MLLANKENLTNNFFFGFFSFFFVVFKKVVFSPIYLIQLVLKSNLIDTRAKKIFAVSVTLLGAVASIYTIASFYKVNDKDVSAPVVHKVGVVPSVALPTKTVSPQKHCTNSYRVSSANKQDDFSNIILNPINLLFLCIMITLFIIDIRTFKTKHVDLKSSISSIGILGTFIGLFIGLIGFDSTQMDESIPLLLDGLKIAFFTSVIGLFLSTILTIYEAFLRINDS